MRSVEPFVRAGIISIVLRLLFSPGVYEGRSAGLAAQQPFEQCVVAITVPITILDIVVRQHGLDPRKNIGINDAVMLPFVDFALERDLSDIDQVFQ